MKFHMNNDSFYTEVPYGKLNISSNDEFGFRPYQLLVSSVATCSGIILKKILQKMRLEVKDILITTEVQRSEKEPHPIQKIKLHYQIKGVNLENSRMEKVLALTDKNCSMIQSIHNAIAIEKSYEFVE